MVPDKFNMVDMEGIDLIESQGLAVDGLYQKLVESIALCRYQCLYNWKFNGILIPPSYVEMEVREDAVWINEGVSVDEEDVIHIYSIEPEPPAPTEPVIEPLSVTTNGTYEAPTGTDGYNPVSVDVPSEEPVIEGITITQNGIVTAPPGTDGYNPITVNVASVGLSSKWDGSFTSDAGIEATCTSVNIVDGDFSFTSLGGSRFYPNFYFKGNKIDVEVDALNMTTGANRRFITTLAREDYGLIYRSATAWAIYLGSWVESPITDINYFNNSKVTVEISSSGVWSVYKDGVFVFDSGNVTYIPPTSFALGASGNSFVGTIKSIKIY